MDAPGAPPSNELLTATTLFLLWTTFFVGVRSWAKTQQQWSWFDAVFIAGYVVGVGQCAAVYVAVGRYGYGQEWEDSSTEDEMHWKKALYASDILYVLSMGISKCSTIFFLNSLSRDRKQTTVGLTLAGLAGSWTVASVFAIALHGDFSAPWSTLGTPYSRWLAVEVTGLVLEGAAWLFAVSLIWPLQMPLSRRLKLLSIFGTRLLLIFVVIPRLWRVSPGRFDPNSPAATTPAYVFTQLVLHFALISECLTCLKPFLQTFHEGLAAPGSSSTYWGGLATMTNSHSRTRQASSGSKDLMSASGASQSHKGFRWRDDGLEEDELRLRGDASGFETRVGADRKSGWRGAEDGIELLETGREMKIRVEKTTVMSSSSST